MGLWALLVLAHKLAPIQDRQVDVEEDQVGGEASGLRPQFGKGRVPLVGWPPDQPLEDA